MTYKKVIYWTILIAFLSSSSIWAQNTKTMMYIYNGPESLNDTRYEYYIKVLKEILERTKVKYGPYILRPSIRMSEARQEIELIKDNNLINIIIRSDNQDYRKTLRPLTIPVDKEILGYRILLIRKQDQYLFDKIHDLSGLKNISIGQGLGWKDVRILEDNGLRVITGLSYEGLFGMLIGKRFDAFSRSVAEIKDEYNFHKNKYSDLAIEKHLLLNYTFTRYFWFSKSSHSDLRFERIHEGLKIIMNDGTLDNLFLSYFSPKISNLNLKGRIFIQLNNNYVSSDRFKDKKFLFNPSLFDR